MDRHTMVERVGLQYRKSNIEGGEWSYAQEAGGIKRLTKLLGRKPDHFKLDIRFTDSDQNNNYAVLIETKQQFKKTDEKQLAEYVEEELVLHPGTKLIAILANTADDTIRVWKSAVDDEHLLPDETVLDMMEHYKNLFRTDRQNNREKVMRNTYALNEMLHKKDIDERNRSQLVGTCLLFVKSEVERSGWGGRIDGGLKAALEARWNSYANAAPIRSAISSVLDGLLDGSDNKELKIKLLKRNVLEDQKVRALTQEDWVELLTTILMDVYRYIDADTSEGQDILNLFFITFNKYVGKADKNQAFTPDHITDFMTRIVDLTYEDVVLDECCGSGSFLVQAMVKELADARNGHTEAEAKTLADIIRKKHIYGIENEEKAYGLATTNMLIHGDGNSNIEFGSCFEKEQFIKNAKPTVILMNPPYNAKPRAIPERFTTTWTTAEKEGKSDPTKGMVFVQYLSEIAKAEKWNGVRLAVLLPMAAAIGTGKRLEAMKEALLKDNTLEAVFSLPAEIFYPGASVQACCMVFMLNRSHYEADQKTPRKQSFFGYYKDDGFVKKKNLGRVEQFDENGQSIWKQTMRKWVSLYRNRTVEPGYSAMHAVTGKDEWLAEAYMETDYSTLSDADFQQTINDYLAYLVKEGRVYED